MSTLETKYLQKFIHNLMEKNFAGAQAALNVVVEAKVKNRIKSAKNKLFGDDKSKVKKNTKPMKKASFKKEKK